ncbi:hypothetical protein [Bradyrhizobium iriomotense]|uniref:hypothetical protein n=1 Tax=Bradyrhizobium iriomotense TaxID=441950 RepID=UPI0024E074D2|nr:hypothetical protein [Bradyrhizobium iriomotense]
MRPVQNLSGASEEVVPFVSKAERERARLIREARAIYDHIFPPVGPLGAQQDKMRGGQVPAAFATTGRGEGACRDCDHRRAP